MTAAKRRAPTDVPLPLRANLKVAPPAKVAIVLPDFIPGVLRAEWYWTDRWALSESFELPLESYGLLRKLLSAAWAKGARLPNDYERIRKTAGISEAEWDRCWPNVSPYWRVVGDQLVNVDQVGDYTKCLDEFLAKQARAKKGAKARWEK